MVNRLLIELTDKALGPSKKTSSGNRAYRCPFCNHHKPKLEINFTKNKKGNNPWHCWVCNEKGLKLSYLFKKAKVHSEYFKELYTLVKPDSTIEETNLPKTKATLPKEYISLIDTNNILAKHARVYLKKRGITKSDIIKYNIGYCEDGDYANRIIIPSYNENGELNYFTARAFKKGIWPNYKNPPTTRNIIPFENTINWNLPLILCEGPFDAIAIKRNVIPLLGKTLQPSLMEKIVTSKVKKIYIALDQDAIKQALKFCEILLNEGKEVYLVELQGKDPSDMGFRKFTQLIQKTQPLTQSKLLSKKISLI